LQVVLAYLSNPTWLLGLLLDVGGGGAMLGEWMVTEHNMQ
jgi:hypothetical protein